MQSPATDAPPHAIVLLRETLTPVKRTTPPPGASGSARSNQRADAGASAVAAPPAVRSPPDAPPPAPEMQKTTRATVVAGADACFVGDGDAAYAVLERGGNAVTVYPCGGDATKASARYALADAPR